MANLTVLRSSGSTVEVHGHARRQPDTKRGGFSDLRVHIVVVLVEGDLVDEVRVGEDLGGLVVVLIVVVRIPGGRAAHIADLAGERITAGKLIELETHTMTTRKFMAIFM